MANSIESERFMFLLILIFALGIVVIYHNVRINEVNVRINEVKEIHLSANPGSHLTQGEIICK